MDNIENIDNIDNIDNKESQIAKLQCELKRHKEIIIEKDFYLSRLETDLEHAISQFKKIHSSRKNNNYSKQKLINCDQPELKT